MKSLMYSYVRGNQSLSITWTVQSKLVTIFLTLGPVRLHRRPSTFLSAFPAEFSLFPHKQDPSPFRIAIRSVENHLYRSGVANATREYQLCRVCSSEAQFSLWLVL